jgi:hypothetical protein
MSEPLKTTTWSMPMVVSEVSVPLFTVLPARHQLLRELEIEVAVGRAWLDLVALHPFVEAGSWISSVHNTLRFRWVPGADLTAGASQHMPTKAL